MTKKEIYEKYEKQLKLYGMEWKEECRAKMSEDEQIDAMKEAIRFYELIKSV